MCQRVSLFFSVIGLSITDDCKAVVSETITNFFSRFVGGILFGDVDAGSFLLGDGMVAGFFFSGEQFSISFEFIDVVLEGAVDET
jgi:hypothetical protein